MRSFTDIKDISSVDIKTILERTKKEKRNIKENGSTGIEKILAGKSVALIFEKPSMAAAPVSPEVAPNTAIFVFCFCAK